MSQIRPSRPIVPVVLCGGGGTRLWPLSTDRAPKQFHALLDSRTLLQSTLDRIVAAGVTAPPVLVGAEAHADKLAAAIEDRCGARALLEPFARNTAVAVGLAAALVARTQPGALVWVLPADHHVGDPAALREPLRRAASAAEAGRIVTFGLTPSRAATEYGWIRPSSVSTDGVFDIDAFVEKPDAAEAALLLAQGCLWNSGMFVFDPSVLLQEMAVLAPEIAGAVAFALGPVAREERFATLVRPAPGPLFAAARVAFDVAVMERTARGAVVALDADWSDVGAWDAIWRLRDKNGDGNAACGEVQFVDTRNTLAHAVSRRVAVIGMDDAIVVETPDAVLVAHRDSAQRVKECALAAADAAAGRPALTGRAPAAAEVARPWGAYRAIDNGAGHQVKHIVVQPGGVLSRQKHFRRAEHWIVVAGEAEVEVDGGLRLLRANQSVFIPQGVVHRLANHGTEPMHLIEVQCGDYFGEDDIVRFDDIYGRAPAERAIAA